MSAERSARFELIVNLKIAAQVADFSGSFDKLIDHASSFAWEPGRASLLEMHRLRAHTKSQGRARTICA